MENGSMADAVIANRGLNFASPYGGGYGYGQHSNAGYDGSVVNANVEANRAMSSLGHESIAQQISDNADRNRDINSQASLTSGFRNMDDKINDQTRFFAQEINMLAREQSASAREAAKCCCDAQVLAVQNQAKTDAGMAQILANQVGDTRVAEAIANAQQNAKLDAILAGNGRGNQGN